MVSSLDPTVIKSFYPFKQFFTRSLRDNDPSFLIRYPDLLLSEKERKARKWVIDHFNREGSLPTVDLLKINEEHCFFFDPIELDIPLKDLYEKAYMRGKAFYARMKLQEVEMGFDIHATNPMPLKELAEATQTILGLTIDPPLSFGGIDRDKLYDVSAKEGLPFGLRFIDEATGGAQPGDLSVVAARPGIGKTLYFCHLAINWAKRGKRVAFASAEMPPSQIMYRLDGILGHFNPKLFRDPSASTKLKALRPLVDIELELIESVGGDISFVPNSQLSVESLSAFVQETRADVLMVDGLYLLPVFNKDKKMSGWEAIKENSNRLKQLALQLGIQVAGTTQFNKEGDIAYSDSILQDADIALGISRDEANNIRVSIIKNRHGEGIGGGTLRDDWDTMGLEEVDPTPVIAGTIAFGLKA